MAASPTDRIHECHKFQFLSDQQKDMCKSDRMLTVIKKYLIKIPLRNWRALNNIMMPFLYFFLLHRHSSLGRSWALRNANSNCNHTDGIVLSSMKQTTSSAKCWPFVSTNCKHVHLDWFNRNNRPVCPYVCVSRELSKSAFLFLAVVKTISWIFKKLTVQHPPEIILYHI